MYVLSYSERSIFAISKPRIYYCLLILNDKTITNNKMIKIDIYMLFYQLTTFPFDLKNCHSISNKWVFSPA